VAGLYARPVPGPITSRYGPRKPSPFVTAFHNGIDYGWLTADPVRSRRIIAPSDGVIVVGRNTWVGNFVTIRVGNGDEIRLCHLESVAVISGARVKRGDYLGVMGRTGLQVTGVHLHLDLFRNGVRINPEPHFETRYGTPTPAPVIPVPPAPEPTHELEDDMTVKVGARKEADGTAKEWMRAAVFLNGGYEVTSDVNVAAAWGRLHGRGHGPSAWDFFVPRADYIAIQNAARTAHTAWLANK
jgi:hypothetical protein